MDTYILYKRAEGMAEEETCKLDDTTSNEYKANCGAGSANARKK